VATKCIKSAMERDTASGNGINIAVVTEDGVDVTKEKDIDNLL
jgi:proteasome beta subunit